MAPPFRRPKTLRPAATTWLPTDTPGTEVAFRVSKSVPAPSVEQFADTAPPTSNWKWVALGLGAIAVVSIAAVIYFIVRRKDGSLKAIAFGEAAQALPPPPQQPQQPMVVTPPIYLINTGSANPATIQPVQPVQPVQPTAAPPPTLPDPTLQSILAAVEKLNTNMSTPPAPSLMQTLPLPVISDLTQSAARCGQATTTMFDVVLRVVGPSGSYAAFSTDPMEINRPNMPATPTGNIVIVPSGQTHMIRLRPREAVYGKGSVPNVLVSVTSSEAGGRIYG